MKKSKKKSTLPKIVFATTQTSKNLFLNGLIRQWYSGFFPSTVHCFPSVSAASLLQFFFRAAMSHSSFDVGHESTSSALLTASLQSSFTLSNNYFKEIQNMYYLHVSVIKFTFNIQSIICI